MAESVQDEPEQPVGLSPVGHRRPRAGAGRIHLDV